MFETARYESERRLPGAAVVALGLSALAAMMVIIAPGLLDQFDVEELGAAFPPELVEAMQLEVIGTIEGFLALELYWFGWLLVFGVYVAYSAAGSIAGDIDDGTMDTLLAAPVSRWGVLGETFLSLLTPILVVNVVVLVVVYVGTQFVGEPVAAADLVAVHALSVPYLLFWGAFGTLASVVAPRRVVAEGVAAGALVATFLVETVADGTDLDWLGTLSPTRYYDPVAILTASEYDLVGAGVLLAGAAALLLAGGALFARRDV
ncbi:ABC transporter permease subunit [Halomarina litorea]|uniref:ABC transporter permease subunit n=1 Tax=Halomarina litorea TaxID=2961595 RepID=UPI0020C3D592|nr:ABC transporter permease subunit [Halomarina sp. BCD28]